MDEVMFNTIMRALSALNTKVDMLQMQRRYVGLPEACKIVGIKRTAMTKRLQAGYYPSATHVNGRWSILASELYQIR